MSASLDDSLASAAIAIGMSLAGESLGNVSLLPPLSPLPSPPPAPPPLCTVQQTSLPIPRPPPVIHQADCGFPSQPPPVMSPPPLPHLPSHVEYEFPPAPPTIHPQVKKMPRPKRAKLDVGANLDAGVDAELDSEAAEGVASSGAGSWSFDAATGSWMQIFKTVTPSSSSADCLTEPSELNTGVRLSSDWRSSDIAEAERLGITVARLRRARKQYTSAGAAALAKSHAARRARRDAHDLALIASDLDEV